MERSSFVPTRGKRDANAHKVARSRALEGQMERLLEGRRDGPAHVG